MQMETKKRKQPETTFYFLSRQASSIAAVTVRPAPSAVCARDSKLIERKQQKKDLVVNGNFAIFAGATPKPLSSFRKQRDLYPRGSIPHILEILVACV